MIAFVGCGGKTSLIEAVIEELKEDLFPIIHTTTTKIFLPETSGEIIISTDFNIHMNAVKNNMNKVITLGYEINRENKVVGLPQGWVDQINRLQPEACILVEADGCKGKSIKLYETFEPCVPIHTKSIVVVIGIDGFTGGDILEMAHRPEQFMSIFENLTLPSIDERIAALFHKRGLIGGLKGTLDCYVFINKVTQENLATAKEIGYRIQALGDGYLKGIILGNTLSDQKVISVIGVR
nr:selenium cofactor biosynthesis protein YqeC [Anaerosolibacter carboniphilus]